MSDPPHLIKKLHNNIYKSGFKENSSRYTRCLRLNSRNILWEHIYSVYFKDNQRHLFSTNIRSSHVHLDSLSKLSVKLAVQVLNSKVQKDMENYENDVTQSIQKYILNCETLWNCFNSTEPLTSLEDTQIQALDDVLLSFSEIGEMNWLPSLKQSQNSHAISSVGKQCLIYRYNREWITPLLSPNHSLHIYSQIAGMTQMAKAYSSCLQLHVPSSHYL